MVRSGVRAPHAALRTPSPHAVPRSALPRGPDDLVRRLPAIRALCGPAANSSWIRTTRSTAGSGRSRCPPDVRSAVGSPRLRLGAPLDPVRDRYLGYVGGAAGYTDHPALSGQPSSSDRVAFDGPRVA